MQQNTRLKTEGQAASTRHHLLLVEHPPVYTLGKSGKPEHLIWSEEERKKRNIEFNVALFASRIKSSRGRGGKVYNITFQDLILKDTITGLAITMYYSNEDFAPPLDISTPHIYDINYQNITGNVLTAGIFGCLPESECRSLTVQDINLYGIIGGFECFRAKGNQIGTVIPESCL